MTFPPVDPSLQEKLADVLFVPEGIFVKDTGVPGTIGTKTVVPVAA